MVFLSVTRLCSSNTLLSLRLLHPQPTTHAVCVLCVFLLALKACSAPQHFHIAYRNVNELNELICLRNAANGYETTEQIFIPTVENVFGLVSPMSTSGL